MSQRISKTLLAHPSSALAGPWRTEVKQLPPATLSTLDADAVNIASVRMQRRMKLLRQRSEIKNRLQQQQQRIRHGKVLEYKPTKRERPQDTQQSLN